MRVTTTLLFSSPAAGFDGPFAMLQACHERVERSLLLLERLATHVAQHGADAQAHDAACDVLRYFDIAAPQHHEDEERHVLPVLRAQGQGALADRIAADHVAISAAWQALRPWLLALQRGDAGAMPQDLPRFAAHYREHIALEEGSVFAPVQAALDDAEQRAMGREMAERRGVVV
jgi:hemerythrin-like domain-containing protein